MAQITQMFDSVHHLRHLRHLRTSCRQSDRACLHTVATNATYAIPIVTPAFAATFSVVVINDETSTRSAPATLKVIDAHLRTTAVASASGIPADGFPLELSVPAGIHYVVQRTTDLTAWTGLADDVGTGSPVVFKDLGATNEVRGLYRLWFP